MTTELDIDDFIGHTGSASGAGFLKKWREDGEIDIWLHKHAGIYPLWSNSFCKVIQDQESGNTIIRGLRFKSMEPETILKKQRFREADGSREYPPTVCPFSKTIEWVHGEVREGRMKLSDPIFHFEADGIDEEGDEREIHAGGFTGQINRLAQRKELKKDQKKEIKKAGIRLDEIYMENGVARLQYVFRVIQNSDPTDGTVIAMESQALGDKMKSAIKKRRMDVGDAGNPMTHPYAFRWQFDENQNFDKKYEVTPMTSLELTTDIQEQFDNDPPSIAELTADGNVAELRLLFEEHWCHVAIPPWDELFADAEKKVKGTPQGELPKDDEAEESVGDENAEFNHGANEVADEDEGCDACGEKMDPQCFDEQSKCSECGAIYGDDPEDEEGMIVISRPCSKCETDITLVDRKGNHICGKCATIHDTNWEPVKAAGGSKKKARRSKRSASRAAS